MKKVVLLSASPRPKDVSTSSFLSNIQSDIIKCDDIDVINIHVGTSMSKNTLQDDYEAMLHADAFIITFPLYVFCLPGMLMRFLQGYYQYWSDNKHRLNVPKKVYSVINCGFPEADINMEAARVIKSFSQKIDSTYRFSLMIGGGGMIDGANDAPLVKKTIEDISEIFAQMASDIVSNDHNTIDDKLIEMNVPRKLYLFFGSRGWFKGGKKNGLKRKDLYRRPYLDK